MLAHSWQRERGRWGVGVAGGGVVIWCALNKCRLPFPGRAAIKNTPPLLFGILLDLDQQYNEIFFKSVPGLHILKGSATENRQQELLIHISMYSFSLHGKGNASLGTDLTSFFDIGKMTAENNCRSTCKPISDRL